jgi:hypothetical protein
MSLLLVDQGEGIALAALVNKTAPQTLVLKLFKNNYAAILDATVESDLTEADFTGYSAITLTGSSWTITPGAPSVASFAKQTFTSSAGSQSQNVYGYYIVQTTSGKLVWAERFADGPYSIVNNGDAISVTPTIQLKKTGE